MKRFLLVPLLALVVSILRAAPEYPKMGSDIYDTHADGEKLVGDALVQARATHRRVLVDFGANWCIWCRRLHQTFTTNPEVRHALDQSYVLVMVDVNRRNDAHRNRAITDRYDDPMGNGHGIPVLVVLNADGKALVTQDTGALENGKDGHDPVKILAFLDRWAPKG